jgi:hypothetical protein
MQDMLDLAVNYTASDFCGPATSLLTVTFTDPRRRGDDDQGEKGDGDRRDDRGHGDDHHGKKSPDFVIVDNHHVRLRADHDDEGRIYSIIVTAVDAAGNTSSRSVTVRVPHGKDKSDKR